MSTRDQNPYAHQNMVAAAAAPVAERAAFLQKTYLLLLAGIVTFAATMFAGAQVGPVQQMAASLFRMHPLLLMAIWIGAAWGVRAVSAHHPINLIAYFAYAFLWGLLMLPLVSYASAEAPDILAQASIITVLVFSGLTGYVFLTRKDFSFLGGVLTIAMFAMLGLIVAGMLFGFQLGLWFSVLGVLVFSGYILYDTSNMLHRYPTNMHVRAAIDLFIDVIMLFQYVLMLLLRSRE